MTEPTFFHDRARAAAEHLLDSPFGRRLAQLTRIETSDAYGWLRIQLDDAENYLSSGELVLLTVLESLAGQGVQVRLTDLDRLDDGNWDRVIAALFLARGRVLA